MTGFHQQLFSFFCGQDPAHTWAPAGAPLPFCERCTGLYLGAVIAVLLLTAFKPFTDARYRWFHVSLLFLMAPFGFHLVPQGPVLRTMSGQWFAFGIVGLLWLGLKSHGMWQPRPDAFSKYLLFGLCSILFLPVFALRGGALASFVLPWVGLCGLFVFATLALANVFVLLRRVSPAIFGR
jgi:uncharacterized membrane protein